MSSSLRSRASISKQRGAEMSSRLIPPKPGAIARTAATISSTSRGGEADRKGVDSAELLEQHRLALHHRQRRLRPDVAEAEHRGAVGHDRHHVSLRGQRPDLVRIVGDRAADSCDPWGVGHREVVARLDRDLGDDLDLAAGVQQEGPVGEMDDLDALDSADRRDYSIELCCVGREDGDVADLRRAFDAHEVDRTERAACLGDRSREAGEGSGQVGKPHANGRAE